MARCLQIGGAVRIVSWLNCLLPSGYTLPSPPAAGRLPSRRGSRTPARVALACGLLVLVHCMPPSKLAVTGRRLSQQCSGGPASLRSKLIKLSSSDLACRRRQQTAAMLRSWCRCAAGRQSCSVPTAAPAQTLARSRGRCKSVCTALQRLQLREVLQYSQIRFLFGPILRVGQGPPSPPSRSAHVWCCLEKSHR